MTIVRRILPVLLAAVLLSACGETKDVLPEIEQEVKQEVETVLEKVEPTPEPTAAPPASADAFAAFESGLDSLGITYERVTMAAEYIGAKTGYKYKTDGCNVELYQFDPDSDAYKQAVSDNAVTLDGFGTIPAYVHGGLAMLCTDGDLPQSVLDVFNAL